MKTFTEFVDYITENIINYLSVDYQDAELKIDHITRSDYEYDALIIRREEDKGFTATPLLDLTGAYAKYSRGEYLDDILFDLAEIRMSASLPSIDREMFTSFAKASERIYPKLINTEANADYLADKPHIEVEDLSMVFAIRVAQNESGFADAVITYDILSNWKVDIETVKSTAMRNLEINVRPVFMNIEEVLFGKRNECADIEDIDPSDYTFPMFVLTNDHKTRGAVMILCRDLMKRITSHMGDVYILPSSVDEVIIVPKWTAEGRDPSGLAEMVRDVNQSTVEPKDRLSDHIYEYDIEQETIRVVA